MIFIDGHLKEHKISLETECFGVKDESKSGPQNHLGRLLSKVYSSSAIIEDFTLPGHGNLSWDFYLPKYSLAFEVNGIQHYEFSKFYHVDKNAFVKQKQRDSLKQKIALNNNIILISFKDTEINKLTLDNLKEIICDNLS